MPLSSRKITPLGNSWAMSSSKRFPTQFSRSFPSVTWWRSIRLEFVRVRKEVTLICGLLAAQATRPKDHVYPWKPVLSAICIALGTKMELPNLKNLQSKDGFISLLFWGTYVKAGKWCWWWYLPRLQAVTKARNMVVMTSWRYFQHIILPPQLLYLCLIPLPEQINYSSNKFYALWRESSFCDLIIIKKAQSDNNQLSHIRNGCLLLFQLPYVSNITCLSQDFNFCATWCWWYQKNNSLGRLDDAWINPPDRITYGHHHHAFTRCSGNHTYVILPSLACCCYLGRSDESLIQWLLQKKKNRARSISLALIGFHIDRILDFKPSPNRECTTSCKYIIAPDVILNDPPQKPKLLMTCAHPVELLWNSRSETGWHRHGGSHSTVRGALTVCNTNVSSHHSVLLLHTMGQWVLCCLRHCYGYALGV